MLGLKEHNFGKPGSGIVASLENDNVKSRCMRLDDGKAEADPITLEIIPNDMHAPLGELTDRTDDTFSGNLNQILEYLLSNTRATVVILIASRGRYNYKNPDEKYTPYSEETQKRILWEKRVEEIAFMHGVPCFNGASEGGLGFYRVDGNFDYVKDQIHLTDKGGEVLARFFAGKLLTLYPEE